MKLLLLAPFPYGAQAGHGGATVCHEQLQQWLKLHEVGLLCFRSAAPGDSAMLAQLAPQLGYLDSVPLRVGRPQVLAAKLGSLLGGPPEHAAYHASPAFSAALHKALAAWQPDLVITQFAQMAQHLQALGGRPSLHDVQDAFSVSWYRRSVTQSGWAGWYARRQWLAWVRYEREHYPKADACWTVSDEDAAGLRVFNPALRVQSLGLPLPQLPAAAAAAAAPLSPMPSGGGLSVGFVGAFSHPPNAEALAFLVDELMPAVAEQLPALRWRVAGRGADPAVLRRAGPQLEYLGFVESLDDFYAGCDLVCAPLRSGGGVKVKVVDAMARGCAVLTTPVGAEGIDPGSGDQSCLEVADERELVQRLVVLAGQPERRQALGRRAAQFAAERFGADAWLQRFEHWLSAVAARDAR